MPYLGTVSTPDANTQGSTLKGDAAKAQPVVAAVPAKNAKKAKAKPKNAKPSLWARFRKMFVSPK